MALRTSKNGRKMFDFTSKTDAQVGEMVKEAVRMVREAASGRRSGYRMGLLDEVAAEAERRGLNTAALALAA